MAQPNSTREKVFQAADAMLEQGVRPTQQSVREHIGSGSLTTINKALNDWWKTLGERITRQNQHPDLPEPVLTAANAMWDRALAYAENQFKEQRQALLDQQKQLKEAVNRSEQGGQDALNEIRAQNTRLLERCETLADDKHRLEQDLLKADDQIYRLTRDLENSQQKLKENARLPGQDSSDALLEAQVRLKIQSEEVERLRHINEELNRENAMLKQQVGQIRSN